MKKILLSATLICLPILTFAQGALDVYKYSKKDLSGTSRYMSMAGAFGALGGDISTLDQNPAGIGVYRNSDLSLTMNLNALNTKGSNQESTNTPFSVNNIGYVGTIRTQSEVCPNFNFGVSFNQVQNFNRTTRGTMSNITSSLSNFTAALSEGINTSNLSRNNDDAFYNGSPWVSVLGYNSYMINPISDNSYMGLYDNATSGAANYVINESGYINDWTINFGGNIQNTVYWGASLGITDLNYRQNTYYTENLDNAVIPSQIHGNYEDGYANNTLSNYQHTTGTGVNFKMGVIVRPINEFRLGFAFHTPTFYNICDRYQTSVDYSYGSGIKGYVDSPQGEVFFNMSTPWKFIASAAVIAGRKGLISFDYEYTGYNTMTIGSDGVTWQDVKDNINSYFKASNTFRVGGEYRVTPQFSLRAGYSYQTSPYKDSVKNNDEYISTVSNNPAYLVDNATQYITAGLGYRFSKFYVDLAYVHKNSSSTYYAFSAYEDGGKLMYNSSDIKYNDNKFSLTLGLKF